MAGCLRHLKNNGHGTWVLMTYIYISLTIFLTVYGQLILKWRISKYGNMPDLVQEKLLFLLRLFGDPFILSGFVAAFGASLFWMAAITKVDVSYAYPFTSAAFLIVLLFSVFIFNEPLTWHKIIGSILIVSGIFVVSQSR